MNNDAVASAIEKATGLLGDQAARVWPQMVEAWFFSNILGIVACLVFLILSGLWCRHTWKMVEDDDAPVWLFRFISSLFFGVAILVILTDGANAVARLRYPEATLAYSILMKK